MTPNNSGQWPNKKPTGSPYQYLAQARAAMLIYLLENKLLKVEEINNRLKQ